MRHENVASLNLSVNSFPLAWKIQINTSPDGRAGAYGPPIALAFMVELG